jgi:hypothetical protein
MAEGESTTSSLAVAKLLDFTNIHYKHFKFIDQTPPSNIIKLGSGRPVQSRRNPDSIKISKSTSIFSVSCVVMEITDLCEHPIDSKDIVERSRDILFRGGRNEILYCIDCMATAELVTISANKVKTNHSYECIFTPKYIDLIKDYAGDVYQTIMQVDSIPLGLNWLSAVRAMYDSFRCRFMPEWYLLLRRVLRASPLTEEQKDALYAKLFTGPTIWYGLNHYIHWSTVTPPAGRTRAAFRSSLRSLSSSIDVDEVIADMVSVRLCGIKDGLLKTGGEVAGVIEEYAHEVAHEYSRLHQFMSSLPADQNSP